MNPNLVWGALLGVCAGYEAWAIATHREGSTLSARLRSWFNTGHTAGKIIFTTLWLLFSSWFIPHIIFGGGK